MKLPPASSRIHFTELGPTLAGDPRAEAWETYRREVGRLLAEGGEGRYALVDDAGVLGTWDTHEAALADAQRRFPGRAFVVHEIREWEPVYRAGYRFLCPELHTPLRKTG